MSGRFQFSSGATVVSVLCGEADRQFLIASDAGYGFVTRLGDLYTKNRRGKALLTLPSKALPLPPMPANQPDSDLLVAVSNEGRMLIYPLSELPTLARGKGNKIINIPAARARNREELLSYLFVLPADHHLLVQAGKRHLRLKIGNLRDFTGKRGQRGRKLPRGFRNVTGFAAEPLPQRTLIR